VPCIREIGETCTLGRRTQLCKQGERLECIRMVMLEVEWAGSTNMQRGPSTCVQALNSLPLASQKLCFTGLACLSSS